MQWPVVSDAALAAPGSRLAPRLVRHRGLTRALLAALAIHAAFLSILLLAVRPARLPEVAELPAVSVVFEPEAPAQPAPSDEQAVAPPPAPPAQPEVSQVPDVPAPPALAQAEPIPDVQALTPPTPGAAPAPKVPALPPRPEPPRSARFSLRPTPPLPTVPKHPQQEPARPQAPPKTATAPVQLRPETGPRQPPSTQVASVSSPSMGEWRNALIAWIEKHKTYPEAAREEGAEGRVLVRFTASRDGRVLDVSIAQSSGSRALDAAALNLVREARLPPFPAGVTQDTLPVTWPLTYQLE